MADERTLTYACFDTRLFLIAHARKHGVLFTRACSLPYTEDSSGSPALVYIIFGGGGCIDKP